jgi:hypothetical protein
MTRAVYTVVLYENQWKVRFGGKHTGPYATQKEATCAAVDAARKTGKTNPDGALVRVQSSDNSFRTEWTYGQDL